MAAAAAVSHEFAHALSLTGVIQKGREEGDGTKFVVNCLALRFAQRL